jgi:uncharacterized RDD family membrane protein YckC
MARTSPEQRTSPDPNERPAKAKTRFVVFAFVIIVSSVVLAAILLFGPFAEPAGGSRPLFVLVVPMLTAVALLATLAWFFIQSRRGR